MAGSEFDLIRRHFAAATPARDDVPLGIGDDAALLQVPAGALLAVSIDTLVEGRHFLAGCDPAALGHKALAVNLSDLAAVGAEPAWATLSLTLPAADDAWLTAFMGGFAALARSYRLQLVGGDTTRGPLSITVQVHGFVAPQEVLRRSGARAGDHLLVSGTIGDAALALREMERGGDVAPALRDRLDRPTPRVALGRLLAGRAHAAVDVSDGLLADLGHLCAASGVGARLDLARVPLSAPVAAACRHGDWTPVLAGGDDYELLFSVSPDRVADLLAECRSQGHAVEQIGRLVERPGIVVTYPDGRERDLAPRGFDHFAASDQPRGDAPDER